MNTTNNKQLTNDQQQLVMDNLSFAMNMGKRFRGRGVSVGVSVEDLQQEACLGLCEAALRYDGTTSFQTYAYNYCLKFILRALRHEGYSRQVVCNGERIIDNQAVEDTGGTSSGDIQGARIDDVLSHLAPLECQVICMVYGINPDDPADAPEPLGFKEIADKLRLPIARVKQIYNNALTSKKCKLYD